MRDNAEYHEHREGQERAAAGVAKDGAIGEIHRDLAERHADQASFFRSPQSKKLLR